MATDRKRLAMVRAASLCLAGETETERAEVEFLCLYLHRAGFPAPPATTLKEFVDLLPRAGWRPTPTYFAPPQSGAFFVQATGQGEVARVGIVGGLEKPEGINGPTGRDWFLAATHGEGRAERIAVSGVSFWLLLPGT